MSDNYRDLHETPVEVLGTAGYCDLAAEVLREIHPTAKTYRITDSSRCCFRHVFLVTAAGPLDVGGFTTMEALHKRYGDNDSPPVEPTDPEAVAEYFLNQRREDAETKIVLNRLREYVHGNLDRYNRQGA